MHNMYLVIVAFFMGGMYPATFPCMQMTMAVNDWDCYDSDFIAEIAYWADQETIFVRVAAEVSIFFSQFDISEGCV